MDEAMIRERITAALVEKEYCEPIEVMEADIDIYRAAYADGQRAGMERAATLAAMFSIEKKQIHPVLPWDAMSENARKAAHMTCQNIAAEIRQAAGEVTGG